MKRIISTVLLGATTSLMALGGEQASLYKDPRIMGMGGANIAVGKYSTTVFSNPAGLASIKKDEGFVVDILNIGISGSQNINAFSNDFNDADGDAGKISDLVDKYTGDVFSLQTNNYSSVSKNSDYFAWSVGLLAASDVTLGVHGNGSKSGAAVEVSGRGYGGLVLGGAKTYETKYGKLDVGVGLKYISQVSYEGPLYLSSLQADEPLDDLQNKYEKTSSGFGLDLGVVFKPFEDSPLHPAIGLSVLNIGAMGMDDNYGQQPTTINIGASISPEVPFLESFVFAVDYVDMFNANEVRVYTFDEGSDTSSYIDYTDSDFLKRLRIGAGFGLVNTSYFYTQVNIGLYQGSYTVGLDLALSIIKLNFATYAEQLGTGSVDIEDRRYMAQIAIGW